MSRSLTGWLGLVVVVMVGFLLDGRERGPGARALAEDVARGLAYDGIQTHRFELVPTPVSSPRLLHSVRRADAWMPMDATSDFTPASATVPDDEIPDAAIESLASAVARASERAGIGVLHAFDTGLAGRVARSVRSRAGIPYCITPRARDLGGATETSRAILRGARHVILFDETAATAFAAAYAPQANETPLRPRTVRRGVDLDWIRPTARPDRARVATRLAARPDLGSRLQGVDWMRACVVLVLHSGAEHDGIESLLFALPEVLRQQAALQVVVITTGETSDHLDRLRAALASGRSERLHEVLLADERFQPLLDHLEHVQVQGRAGAWWSNAARLEPERRVRFTGPVSREEFALLLGLADFLVLPGQAERPSSHALVEALASGVLGVGAAPAGAGAAARLIAEEISGEIGSLCVLHDDAPAVREIEAKLGRLVRLRPEVADRLRALAVRKFDGRQTAADLRRLYGEATRVAVSRS